MHIALARVVLDAGAEAINDFRAGVEDRTKVVVCRPEAIASRIIRVGIEVREDLRHVDLARVRPVGIMQPHPGHTQLAVAVAVVEHRTKTDRPVVDAV